MYAVTDKPVEGISEGRWEDVRSKKVQDAVKEREVLTPPRKDAKTHPESAACQVPSTSQSTASKQPPLVKCCKGVGGGVWLGLVENCAAFSKYDDTLRDVQHLSDEGLALQARV